MTASRAAVAFVVVVVGASVPGAEAGGDVIQARVHGEVRSLLQAGEGRVLFTDLWNGDRLSAPEKDYAARLYEVFFAIPAQVQAELKATGRPPTRAAIAANFGLTRDAVDVLLAVMAGEPRMPKLLQRDAQSGEIVGVDRALLDTFVATRGSPVRVSGWEGKALPAFSLPAIGGGTIAAEHLAGQPALVWIWLTRCPMCRRVTPSLVELDRRLGPRGLRVVGLNSDGVLGLNVPDAERDAWLAEQGVRYANAVLDPATRAAFGQNIFPAFFLVGRDGRVRKLILNERSLGELEELVRPLLEDGAEPRS